MQRLNVYYRYPALLLILDMIGNDNGLGTCNIYVLKYLYFTEGILFEHYGISNSIICLKQPAPNMFF